MKRLIAGLIAGLVLGTTATGVAATQYSGWQRMNGHIECKATSKSVMCSTIDMDNYDYTTYISACSVSVDQWRGTNLKTVFERWQGPCR